MLTLVSLALADADCGVREALAATHRWGEVEPEVFRAATARLLDALDCIDGKTLSAAEVSAIHLAVARVAWLDTQSGVEGATSRQEWSTRGMVAARPGDLPPPLDQDPALLAAAARPLQCGAALRRGPFTVNAVPGTCLPDLAAAVVQDPSGRAWYILPGEAPREIRRRRSLGLLGAGMGTAAVGAALLGGAALTRAQFQDTADAAEAQVLDRANLGLGIAGYGVLATGAALGAAALWTGEW